MLLWYRFGNVSIKNYRYVEAVNSEGMDGGKLWYEWQDPLKNCSADVMAATRDYVCDSIRTALASVSDLAMIQMQDVLDLGAAGRMNFPGTLSDSNWTWRIKDDIMTLGLAKKLQNLRNFTAVAAVDHEYYRTSISKNGARI